MGGGGETASEAIPSFVRSNFDGYPVLPGPFQLEWAFVCGGLCGMGFTRNKVVVLDSEEDVIAMYRDGILCSR